MRAEIHCDIVKYAHGLILCSVLFCASCAGAAGVSWNVFSIADYNWGAGDATSGHSICYYDYVAQNLGITPEAGFTITKKNALLLELTFTGNYSNVGANATFWASAAAGTILTWDWMNSQEPLLDMGLGEYSSEGTLNLHNNESAYIAVLGDSWNPDPAERYYTGWVEIRNVNGEIVIDSSALSFSSLRVGSGETFDGLNAIPEPSSALLMLIGLGLLGLRRKTIKIKKSDRR